MSSTESMEHDFRSRSEVALSLGTAGYPRRPYSPSQRYPEYPFAHLLEGEENAVYDSVREAFRLLRLDPGLFGSSEWNPLKGLVRPGDKVVLKPNLVRDFRETQPGHADCVITHGSVIRAVVDYVYIALEGRGRIIIADAPHNDADFDAIRRIVGLDELQAFYREHAGFNLEVYDLRPEKASKIDGVIVGHTPLPGDPEGYVKVDLADRSAFVEVNDLCHLLYGSEYDTREIVSHHTGGRHAYLACRTVLSADVVICLPKLKTHKKVGLTVNMKNLVGINGNKNLLPHHREGTPSQGGDQFADNGLKRRLERGTVARFKQLFPLLGPIRPMVAGPIKALGKRLFGDTNTDTIRSGNWYGNDTTWRTCIDLNRMLMYADGDGRLHDAPVRRFFSVVDGIIGGEGNGPLDPRPKPAGAILAGFNPVAVDLACARLMGFDYRRIPMLRRALESHSLPLVDFEAGDVRLLSNDPAMDRPLLELEGPLLAFEPHFGWKGQVEVGAPEGVKAAI